jgi:hypothetical protein
LRVLSGELELAVLGEVAEILVARNQGYVLIDA